MVDRDGRDRLIESIGLYLDGAIGAFELDDRNFEIACESRDPTVGFVVHCVWFHYDDCTDHKVRLTKAEWDYFQRLLLLLRSNATVETTRTCRRRPGQIVAGLTLGVLGAVAILLGPGLRLLLLAPLGGIVSIGLWYWRWAARKPADSRGVSLVPFASLGQLRTVCRSVPAFQKRRYPPGIDRPDRALSRWFHNALWWVVELPVLVASWLVFSPVVLLFQTLPGGAEESRVILPDG